MNQDIAIIGLQVALPDTKSPWRLYHHLSAQSELTSKGHDASGKIQTARGLLSDYQYFDYQYFDLSEREAAIMDPQHRICLQLANDTLISAGYAPSKPQDCSVFASCSANPWHWQSLRAKDDREYQAYLQLLANDKDFLATRVAYKLDLRGPALNIQCGCSSSLVALHYACNSLRLGETNMAMVLGASAVLPMQLAGEHVDGMIFSPTGECRAYMKNADGTVSGSGAVAILLKPLAQAEQDGDDIWAVIAGSAINNDGKLKVNFTSPSVEQQMAVMHKALQQAQISPDQVNIIEGHGTGTVIGDAIELDALEQVYSKKRKCYLGSVKSNVGHLDAASGLVSIAKLALSAKYQTLFAQPYADRYQPATSNFDLLTISGKWSSPFAYMAVTSLGVGGTNVHMILRSHLDIASKKTVKSGKLCWFPISAATHEGVMSQVRAYCDMLSCDESIPIDQLSASMQFACSNQVARVSLLANNSSDLLQQLKTIKATDIHDANTDSVLGECHAEDSVEVLHELWSTGFTLIGATKPATWCSIPALSYELIQIKPPYELPHTQLNQERMEVTSVDNSSPDPSLMIRNCWIKALGDGTSAYPQDNFFEQGGDSLLAVGFTYDLSQALGKAVSPVLLFDKPTLSELYTYFQSSSLSESAQKSAGDDEFDFMEL